MALNLVRRNRPDPERTCSGLLLFYTHIIGIGSATSHWAEKGSG